MCSSPYSDILVIFVETLEVMVFAFDILSTESEPLGFKVLRTRLEFRNLLSPWTRKSISHHIRLFTVGTILSTLRVLLEAEGWSFPKRNKRMGIASSGIKSLNRNVWKCRDLYRRTNISFLLFYYRHINSEHRGSRARTYEIF